MQDIDPNFKGIAENSGNYSIFKGNNFTKTGLLSKHFRNLLVFGAESDIFQFYLVELRYFAIFLHGCKKNCGASQKVMITII